jgi:hypothetical protein
MSPETSRTVKNDVNPTSTDAAMTPGHQILYIVGNGFDLHHGIESGYQDFGEYLARVDNDTYDHLSRYFSVNEDFWWQFEAQLAHLDTDSLLDNAGQFLASYGEEDWSDASHHDYQYELDRVVEALSKTLRHRFGQWVRQLEIPQAPSLAGRLLPLPRDAKYLTFNYTDTLQCVYGVPDSNVLHIHGAANQVDDQLILGHGWKRSPADSFNHGIDHEEADTRVLEGNNIIDEYFSATFKPTDRVIAQHQPFFRSLSDIWTVLVMGHSLSEVDMPYIREVLNHVSNDETRWQVSFYESSEDAEAAMGDLGVPADQTRYVPLTTLPLWAP